MSLDDPVVITCSISGVIANREQCPAIPYTPEEYGAGYYVMCGRAYEPDLIVGWPTAEISVMGAEGMVGIAAKKLFGDAPPPPEVKQGIIAMIQKNIDVMKVAGWGLIDDVIDPRDTRRAIAWGLELSRHKRLERPAKKRGIIPV